MTSLVLAKGAFMMSDVHVRYSPLIENADAQIPSLLHVFVLPRRRVRPCDPPRIREQMVPVSEAPRLLSRHSVTRPWPRKPISPHVRSPSPPSCKLKF